MKKFKRDESGQVLVIVALSLVVLLGFTALAIDVGMMMHKRAQLQKAADAAALAGIMDVWEKADTHSIGIATAENYALSNGASQVAASVSRSHPSYTSASSMIGDPIFLEVICEGTVNHYFAPIIGIHSTHITAEAVAVKTANWIGEALPFVNLGTKPGSGAGITLWDKEGPGVKESIWKHTELTYLDHPIPHFKVNYGDGVDMEDGKNSSIEGQISTMWNYYENSSQTVYVLSLRPEIFDAKQFVTEQGEVVKLPECKELKNKSTIKKSDLVLLECTWNNYYKKKGNNMVLDLKVVNIHSLDDVPDSYDGVGEMHSYLIK